MRIVPSSLFALVVLIMLTSQVDATAQLATIEGKLRLPDDTTVNTTRIVLNDGDQITYSRLDGSFSFYNVPPGIHLLDVHSHQYMFSQVKVQLLEESMDAPKCIEYVYPGANKQVIMHPLVLTAHAKYDYFEPPPKFSLFSIFKNPMFLMMLVSVGLMFLMPKMMENLEPEEKERMQRQMEMQKDPSKMISQLFGDLTGTSQEEQVAPKKRNKRD